MAYPKGVISPADAKALNDAYSARHTVISNFMKRDDNRSAWFSLEDLQAYLTQVKKDNPDMDGVRIYMGAYADDKGGQPGYTTVFIVPTAPNSLGKDGNGGSGDIPGGSGLNYGGNGNPPGANYPQ